MIAYIKTADSVCVIPADTLIFEPNATHVYAYNGEKLVGMWRVDTVIDAHLTERKSDT